MRKRRGKKPVAKYVTPSAMARHYGVTKQCVWKWIRRGILKAFRIRVTDADLASRGDERTGHGRLLIPMDEAEAFIARQRGGLMGGRVGIHRPLVIPVERIEMVDGVPVAREPDTTSEQDVLDEESSWYRRTRLAE